MLISLVGFGTAPREHVTLGAIRIFRDANRVLYFGRSEALLKALGITDCASLEPLYKEGAIDKKAYSDLAQTIIAAAKEVGKVAVALPGHPLVGVSLVRILKSFLTAESGIKLIIEPGISSLDTMLVDEQLDPLELGTLLVDANRIILFRQILPRDFNVFIYHVCSVGTERICRSAPSQASRLDILRAFLLDQYSPSQSVYLLRSRDEFGPTTKRHSSLSSLSELAPFLSYSSTLFIPAAIPSKINMQFLAESVKKTCDQ